MKIKDGFAKREIAGSFIVVPVGAAGRDFNGMITLNESGSFFWDCFQKDITAAEAVKMITDEYDVSADVAADDVENFINQLRENNLIDE